MTTPGVDVRASRHSRSRKLGEERRGSAATRDGWRLLSAAVWPTPGRVTRLAPGRTVLRPSSDDVRFRALLEPPSRRISQRSSAKRAKGTGSVQDGLRVVVHGWDEVAGRHGARRHGRFAVFRLTRFSADAFARFVGRRADLLQVQGFSVAQLRSWSWIQAVFSYGKSEPRSIPLMSPWLVPVCSASPAWVSRLSQRLSHSSFARSVSPLRNTRADLTVHVRAEQHPATEEKTATRCSYLARAPRSSPGRVKDRHSRPGHARPRRDRGRVAPS